MNIESMSMDEKIKRINELYHLSKERELTAEEKEEQGLLRKAYVASIKGSLQSQLDSISIKEKDGSVHKLEKKKK